MVTCTLPTKDCSYGLHSSFPHPSPPSFYLSLYRIVHTWAAKFLKEIRSSKRINICTQEDDAAKPVRQNSNSYCQCLCLEESVSFIQCYGMNTSDRNIGMSYLQYKQCLIDFLDFLKKITSWYAGFFLLKVWNTHAKINDVILRDMILLL